MSKSWLYYAKSSIKALCQDHTESDNSLSFCPLLYKVQELLRTIEVLKFLQQNDHGIKDFEALGLLACNIQRMSRDHSRDAAHKLRTFDYRAGALTDSGKQGILPDLREHVKRHLGHGEYLKP